MRSRGNGFTLVELTVVLLLAGVLSALTVMSFASATRVRRLETAISQLRTRDQLCRAQAVQFDRTVENVVPAQLGDVRIERVWMEGSDAAASDAMLRYSSLGHSPSYAVHLVDPHGEAMWLLVAGLTGQAHATQDESEINSILSGSLSYRHDAD